MSNNISSFQGKISIFTVLLVGFIDYFGIGLVYPLFSIMFFDPELPFFLPETSSSIRGFYLGLLLALQPLFQFFSAPILGIFSDQIGRRKILAIALLIALFGYGIGVLAVFSYNLYGLLLYRIVVGISAGSTSVVQASLSDMSTKETKSKNFGLYNMALGTGFTIGPFLGGKLTDPSFFRYADFYTPFLLTACIVFLNLLLVIFIFKETLKVKEKKEVNILTGIRSMRKAFRLKGIRILFLCTFTFVFGWSFFFEFMPVYLIHYFQFQASDIGNLFGISGAVFAISSGILIRPIVSRFSVDSIFFWSLVLNSLIIFSIFLAPTNIWIYILVGCTNFMAALCFPSLTTLISNETDEKMQGEILGIFNSIIGLALGVSPLFSGALVGAYPTMSIFIGGLCMLITSVILAPRKFSKSILKNK